MTSDLLLLPTCPIMVFFTCNACGSSLKKNQVEKHYRNECRNCSVLSCMDCGQDFYGDDYAGHTKCISEAEKYQGAMYKGTGSKGDQKQEAWLEKAQAAIQGAKVSPRIASLLQKIAQYPNIPRKKKKFENFVRNSCCVRDEGTLEQLWVVFNDEPQETSKDSATQKNDVSGDGVACAETTEGTSMVETGKENVRSEKRHKKKKRSGPDLMAEASLQGELTEVKELNKSKLDGDELQDGLLDGGQSMEDRLSGAAEEIQSLVKKKRHKKEKGVKVLEKNLKKDGSEDAEATVKKRKKRCKEDDHETESNGTTKKKRKREEGDVGKQQASAKKSKLADSAGIKVKLKKQKTPA